MRCLLVSDLHYSLKQFDWVTDVAATFDVVVIAGDHIDISGFVDGHVQTTVVMKYFRSIREKTHVIVCSGNHDLDTVNEAGEKFAKWIMKGKRWGIAVDRDAIEVEGSLFTICPWWDGPKTREEVDAQLRRDSARRNGCWIWVYHSPPDSSPTSSSARGHFGDADLYRWIEQYSPDIVLTGHIHDSPFLAQGSWVDRLGTTWVFNAGRQIGPLPTHVVFDTEQQAAFWFSMDRVETVQLDRALARPLPRLNDLPDWFK